MKQTVEDHARAKGVDPGVLAALRVQRGWPKGQRLSEEAFDAAVSDALGSPLAPRPLSPNVPERDTLIAHGYRTVQDVKRAQDAALLDLPGIGEVTLARIREAIS